MDFKVFYVILRCLFGISFSIRIAKDVKFNLGKSKKVSWSWSSVLLKP